MSNIHKVFWGILFDEGESVCQTSDVRGTRVSTFIEVGDPPNFFAINPLQNSRRDVNVTTYRNILLEFDTLRPSEQLRLIDDIPHSTVVWSGGKSYHCIISLETPLANRAEYDLLVQRIYSKVPQADKSGKNPSRLSRAPGAMRAENSQEQTLYAISSRVSRERLDAWLGPADAVKLKTELPRYAGLVPMMCFHYLQFGAPVGGRNSALFRASCDLFKAGYGVEEVIELTSSVSGLSAQETRQTVKSALRTVRGQ